MDLCRNSFSGVSVLGDGSVSDEAYAAVLASVFTFDELSKAPDKHLQSKEAKQAHAGLLTLLLEACKNDSDSNIVSSVLEDCKVPTDRSSAFVKRYLENKNRIQNMLSRIGKSHDHIVDVNWRQDLIIKTNSCERIGEQNYIISFKTLNPETNLLDEVTFGCTLGQLQDLVFKLKDASKCIERTSTH